MVAVVVCVWGGRSGGCVVVVVVVVVTEPAGFTYTRPSMYAVCRLMLVSLSRAPLCQGWSSLCQLRR